MLCLISLMHNSGLVGKQSEGSSQKKKLVIVFYRNNIVKLIQV